MANPPALRTFLNKLDVTDVNSLLKVYKISKKAQDKCNINFDDSANHDETNFGAVEALDGLHDGQWWMDKCTCCLVPGDLRWQINGPAKGAGSGGGTSLTTPVKGKKAAIHNVSRVLTGDAKKELRELCDAAGGDKPNVKIWGHHLAFLVGPFRSDLPPSLGSGSAISHLCDESCVAPPHCLLESQKGNMSRINCTGTTILVKSGVIIEELPCLHAKRPDGTVDWDKGCTRARVWESDRVYVPQATSTEFELKAANYAAMFDWTAE